MGDCNDRRGGSSGGRGLPYWSWAYGSAGRGCGAPCMRSTSRRSMSISFC